MQKLLTIKMASELLHRYYNTTARWVSEGLFPNASKIRGGWHIPEGDIRRLLRAGGPTPPRFEQIDQRQPTRGHRRHRGDPCPPILVRLFDQRVEQFPVAKPADYQIRYAEPGQVAPMTKALAQFDQSARAWLVAAEFPANLGNSLITNIEMVAQATKHMSADELESYGLVEYEKLQQVYGPALEEKLQSAAVMIHALDQKTPGLRNLLKSKGIGDNALVVAQLIGQSERY